MAARNKHIPLFDGFVKAAVGVVVFIYLFGIFWYPIITDAILDIVIILGLCFRFTYVINSELPKWKIFTAFFFYIAVLLDQIFDVVLAGGSLDKLLTSSSAILIFILISVFFLDLWQLYKTKQVKKGSK